MCGELCIDIFCHWKVKIPRPSVCLCLYPVFRLWHIVHKVRIKVCVPYELSFWITNLTDGKDTHLRIQPPQLQVMYSVSVSDIITRTTYFIIKTAQRFPSVHINWSHGFSISGVMYTCTAYTVTQLSYVILNSNLCANNFATQYYILKYIIQ